MRAVPVKKAVLVMRDVPVMRALRNEGSPLMKALVVMRAVHATQLVCVHGLLRRIVYAKCHGLDRRGHDLMLVYKHSRLHGHKPHTCYIGPSSDANICMQDDR